MRIPRVLPAALPSAHPDGESDPRPGRQRTRGPWHALAVGHDAAKQGCARDTRNHGDESQRPNAEGGRSRAWPALRLRLHDTPKAFWMDVPPLQRRCNPSRWLRPAAAVCSVLGVTAGPLSHVLRFTEPHSRKNYPYRVMTLTNK